MSDRDSILQRVNAATKALPERTAMPDYAPARAVKRNRAGVESAERQFAAELTAVNGKFLDGWSGIAALLKEQGCAFGYCDAELLPGFQTHVAGIEAHSSFERDKVDLYEFGITRAAGAIAETGTIVLNDACSPYRLASLAPWIHIAVVDPKTLWPSTVEAIAAIGSDPNVVWVTGPSKTADVEGIMVEGVHGPGVQACCLLPDQSV